MELRAQTRFTSATVRSWDRAALAAALFLTAWVFYRNTFLASRLIDGTRYFLLDDDMMISMRYGRNLAEGIGLVWNAGERVEGYTNFLWTLVMAGVHLTGVTDANAAVAVRVVSFGLLAASFHLAIRLLRIFAPRSLIAVPILLLSMMMCMDIIHWSVWGFETTLLTLVNLLFLVRIVEGKEGILCFAALSACALTRGDGSYIFAANALIALVLSKNPRRTMIYLALALVPFVVHLVFRHAYYGDWLPNTYYLKVFELDDTQKRGANYARNFLLTYSILVALSSGAALAILRTDRRGIVFFVSILSTLGYVVFTGGDMFGNFRFFAHVMPILFVFAAAGVARVARGKVGPLVWGAVLVLISVPLVRPLDRLIALDSNGDPYDQIHVALLMKKNARPESSVAVITAGILPYFTRMRAIDILGKSDRHIARLKPFPGSMVGHGKIDPLYTLGKRPDLVVSCRSNSFVTSLPMGARTTDVVFSFLASQPFQIGYRSHFVSEPFLLDRTSVYTHPSSPEYGQRQWKSVTVSP